MKQTSNTFACSVAQSSELLEYTLQLSEFAVSVLNGTVTEMPQQILKRDMHAVLRWAAQHWPTHSARHGCPVSMCSTVLLCRLQVMVAARSCSLNPWSGASVSSDQLTQLRPPVGAQIPQDLDLLLDRLYQASSTVGTETIPVADWQQHMRTLDLLAMEVVETSMQPGATQGLTMHQRERIEQYTAVVTWIVYQTNVLQQCKHMTVRPESGKMSDLYDPVYTALDKVMQYEQSSELRGDFTVLCYKTILACGVLQRFIQNNANGSSRSNVVMVFNNTASGSSLRVMHESINLAENMSLVYKDKTYVYHHLFLTALIIEQFVSFCRYEDWQLHYLITNYEFWERHIELWQPTRYRRPRLPIIVALLGKWYVSSDPGTLYDCDSLLHALITWIYLTATYHSGKSEDGANFATVIDDLLPNKNNLEEERIP